MNFGKQCSNSVSQSVVYGYPFKIKAPSNCPLQLPSVDMIEGRLGVDHSDVSTNVVPQIGSIGGRWQPSRKCIKRLDILCTNMVSYVLSFLEQHEIERFGLVSKAYLDISRLSNLWTCIKLRRSDFVGIHTLSALIKRTSPSLPLLDLNVSGHPYFAGTDSTCNGSCSSVLSPSAPSVDTTPLISPLSTSPPAPCSTCGHISAISQYLKDLRSLTLNCVSWGGTCSLQSIISSTTTLLSLTISHDVDVNVLVRCVSCHCPLLESLHFSYVNVLAFEQEVTPIRCRHSRGMLIEDVEAGDESSWGGGGISSSSEDTSTASTPYEFEDDSEADSDTDVSAFGHPLLLPEVGRELSEKCPLIRSISFSHYTIDEDGVQQILNLTRIQEANFSDNESLHGTFLSDLPARWPQLQLLTLRDCTELTDEHVTAFALALAGGGCPQLRHVDLSCQWAFYYTSLLSPAVRGELVRRRGASFSQTAPPLPPVVQAEKMRADSMCCAVRWREDQCEVPGFGVDPEDGIDSIDDELQLLEGGGEEDCNASAHSEEDKWTKSTNEPAVSATVVPMADVDVVCTPATAAGWLGGRGVCEEGGNRATVRPDDLDEFCSAIEMC